MAESSKVLRRRVRTVKNIGKITRAMEMVAASKLRRAQGVLLAARPYAAKLQELLGHLSRGPVLAQHPLFQDRSGPRKILVIFTADRGLNGSFNTNIIKKAEELLKSEPETQWQLVCVGKKGRDYFARRKWPILEAVIGMRGQASSEEAQRIGRLLVEKYLTNATDKVLLVYSRFISTVVYQPTLAQYLPLTAQGLGLNEPAESRRELDYIMEPSPERVVDALLPRFLASKIYITMAEVATSEHSATMVAMNNATKNCKEIGDALTLKMNKARQAAITKELQEIVGGAEALKTA